MFAGISLSFLFPPPQILAASTVFFCPIPETVIEVMVSFGATAAGLFEQ